MLVFCYDFMGGSSRRAFLSRGESAASRENLVSFECLTKDASICVSPYVRITRNFQVKSSSFPTDVTRPFYQTGTKKRPMSPDANTWRLLIIFFHCFHLSLPIIVRRSSPSNSVLKSKTWRTTRIRLFSICGG